MTQSRSEAQKATWNRRYSAIFELAKSAFEAGQRGESSEVTDELVESLAKDAACKATPESGEGKNRLWSALCVFNSNTAVEPITDSQSLFTWYEGMTDKTRANKLARAAASSFGLTPTQKMNGLNAIFLSMRKGKKTEAEIKAAINAEISKLSSDDADESTEN
jgi:hypothetical protein